MAGPTETPTPQKKGRAGQVALQEPLLLLITLVVEIIELSTYRGTYDLRRAGQVALQEPLLLLITLVVEIIELSTYRETLFTF